MYYQVKRDLNQRLIELRLLNRWSSLQKEIPPQPRRLTRWEQRITDAQEERERNKNKEK